MKIYNVEKTQDILQGQKIHFLNQLFLSRFLKISRSVGPSF